MEENNNIQNSDEQKLTSEMFMEAFDMATDIFGNVMRECFENVAEEYHESKQSDRRVGLINSYKKEEMEFYHADELKENPFSTTTQNLWYMHYLNKKRLKKLGLKVQFQNYAPTSEFVYGDSNSYPKFTYSRDGKNRLIKIADRMHYQKKYIQGMKVLWTDKGNGHIGEYYMVQTKTEDGKCICPSCGYEDELEKFLDGCDYCNTKFEIKDFDEKLSSVYNPGDNTYSRDASQMKKNFKTKYIPLIILAVVLSPLLLLCFPFILIGYVIYSISATSKTVKEDTEFGPIRTERTVEKIRGMNKDFSVEVFISNLTNKLIAICYADIEKEISIFASCDCSALLRSSQRAIDAKLLEYTLMDYRTDKVFEYIDVRAHLKLAYFDEQAVLHEKRLVYLTVLRDKTAIEKNASAVNVYRCKGCGASVSLLNGGVCEYCQNVIDLKKYDWVIEKFEILNENTDKNKK